MHDNECAADTMVDEAIRRCGVDPGKFTIQIDTREKRNAQILTWFEKHNIRTIRSKLYMGDYTRLDKQDVCIDRKAGMCEVYSNMVQQHDRFAAELQKAQATGIRLIVLIESENLHSIEDVERWTNPRMYMWLKTRKGAPPMASSALMKAMQTMTERYGVEWRFCNKMNYAATMIQILTEEDGNNGN